MKAVFDTYKPPHFHTLNTYLFVHDPEALILFLKEALYAKEVNRTMDDSNTIVLNVIMEIGDSSLMISQSNDQFPAMPTSFYLFVADCDAIYQNALNHQAISIMPPFDMPYGDRQAGVKDSEGNLWWISTRLVKEPYMD